MTPGWIAAIADYLHAQASVGAPKPTVDSRRSHLQHLARRIHSEPWVLTADELVQWCGSQKWAQETRRGRRTTFRSFYAWAVETGRCEANPALALGKVKPGQPRPRPIPEELFEAALLKADQRMRLVLRLAHDAGMRRGEIAVVHSDDLVEDFIGWTLIVHGKGNKDRPVPLTRRLAFELRALGYGYAFPGDDDGHLSPRWVGKLATNLLPGKWTLHTLRHSFASRTYAVDRDVFAVQDLLGHSSPATTRRYVVVPNDALRRTVDAAAGESVRAFGAGRWERQGEVDSQSMGMRA
ncbi:Site-specific recombinase XerD [Agreia sp. VKM Ac-1783]|nr:Site-specific recombinase XerD [Agreia sp. VKM Ac-1783]